MITIDDFKKLEIKIGQIISAEKVADADRLVKLLVNFSEDAPRQIISGISTFYPDPTVLVGRKCAFATNLEPRVIKGLESNGMILAVSGENFFSLLETTNDTLPGSTVK